MITHTVLFCCCWESTGVSIQPFQTPPMARPRFHSHTESLVRSGAQQQQHSGLGLQNFNLLPVKDTNGRNGSTSGNNKIAIEEDDIIPVKEAPLSAPPTVVATTNISNSCSSPPQVPSKQQIIPAEKDILILDKDFDDKIKSISSFVCFLSSFILFLCNPIILSDYSETRHPTRDPRRPQRSLQFGNIKQPHHPAEQRHEQRQRHESWHREQRLRPGSAQFDLDGSHRQQKQCWIWLIVVSGQASVGSFATRRPSTQRQPRPVPSRYVRPSSAPTHTARSTCTWPTSRATDITRVWRVCNTLSLT